MRHVKCTSTVQLQCLSQSQKLLVKSCVAQQSSWDPCCNWLSRQKYTLCTTPQVSSKYAISTAAICAINCSPCCYVASLLPVNSCQYISLLFVNASHVINAHSCDVINAHNCTYLPCYHHCCQFLMHTAASC